MGATEGGTVGMAVGIPAGVIIVGCLAFWYYNQRKQKKEDEEDKYGLEVEMRDDHLFSDFQQELLRKKGEMKAGNQKEKTSDKGAYGGYQLSLSNGSSSSTNFVDKRPTGHNKTGSSYDFYESVIPIIPPSTYSKSSMPISSSNNLVGSGNGQDSIANGPGRKSTSQVSLFTSGDSSGLNANSPKKNNKSIENLVKQLHAPAYFDKIPSKVPAPSYTIRSHSTGPNNSSSDLIHNTLVAQDDAINAHYTYSHASHPLSNGIRVGHHPEGSTSHNKRVYDMGSFDNNNMISAQSSHGFNQDASTTANDFDDSASDPELMEETPFSEEEDFSKES